MTNREFELEAALDRIEIYLYGDKWEAGRSLDDLLREISRLQMEVGWYQDRDFNSESNPYARKS